MLNDYELTDDGSEVFNTKLMSEEMAKDANELAKLVSGENFFWKKVK